MTITYVQKATDNSTELGMVRSLMHYFDWRQSHCFWNTHLFSWESDLLVLSKNKYLTEVEVKVSWHDWKNDLEKSKWGGAQADKDREYIRNFYYAVPKDLYAQKGEPEGLPEGCGLLLVEQGPHRTYVREGRKATPKASAKPLSDSMVSKMFRNHYFRTTDKFIRGKF